MDDQAGSGGITTGDERDEGEGHGGHEAEDARIGEHGIPSEELRHRRLLVGSSFSVRAVRVATGGRPAPNAHALRDKPTLSAKGASLRRAFLITVRKEVLAWRGGQLFGPAMDGILQHAKRGMVWPREVLPDLR